MIDIEEKNDQTPLCPHCQSEIRKVWYRRLIGLFGKRYIYFCPSCKAVLGISHRKGFWMG